MIQEWNSSSHNTSNVTWRCYRIRKHFIDRRIVGARHSKWIIKRAQINSTVVRNENFSTINRRSGKLCCWTRIRVKVELWFGVRGTTRDSHLMCNNVYSFGSWNVARRLMALVRWTVLLVMLRFKFTSNEYLKRISNWILRESLTEAIHVGDGHLNLEVGQQLNHFSLSQTFCHLSRTQNICWLVISSDSTETRRQLKMPSW